MTETHEKPYRIGWSTHRWPSWREVFALTTGTWIVPPPYPGPRAPRVRVPRHVPWAGIRRDLRHFSFHRPWQAEAEEQRFARRALTAAGAVRKMTADVEHMRRTGDISPYQRRRWDSAAARHVIAEIEATR